MSATEIASGTKTEPCRCLRTKNAYGTLPLLSEAWIPGTHAASSYWCLLTQASAGPDEQYVHLARCVPGRACYEAPEE